MNHSTVAIHPQPKPDSPQRDSEVSYITPEGAMADLVAAWQSYRSADPRSVEKYGLGLKFGQFCCEVRDKFKAPARKGAGFQAILEQSGIGVSVAYGWMSADPQKFLRRQSEAEGHERAAQSLAIAWNDYYDSGAPRPYGSAASYKGNEKYGLGLKFGQLCCELTDKFRAQGHKGGGFNAILKRSGVPCSRGTVQKWIDHYKMSAGIKPDNREQRRKAQSERRKVQYADNPEKLLGPRRERYPHRSAAERERARKRGREYQRRLTARRKQAQAEVARLQELLAQSAAPAELADLLQRLSMAENEVTRLRHEDQGQEAKIASTVKGAIPVFERLFSVPEIESTPRLLLDGWIHPDFNRDEIRAAREAVISRRPLREWPTIAARWFVALTQNYDIATVKRYHNRSRENP